MKILHIAETFKGGVGTVVDELIFYQSNCGSDFSVVSLIPEQHIDNFYKSKNAIFFTFDRKKRGIKSLYNFAKEMKKVIYKEKPDIVHLHSTFAGFVGRLVICISGMRREVKLVYSPHAFPFIMKSSSFKKKIFSSIEYLLSFLTDKIICVSDYEYSEALSAGIRSCKLAVVYNGVSPGKIESFKDKSSEDKIQVLFVGRFDHQKGIDTLIDAIHLLNEEDKSRFFFNFVGDSVNDDRGKKIIPDDLTQYIKQHGWLEKDKIIEQYKLADVIILPSRWEGFAMVPLEAMAQGVAVIASDIPPFKELIDDKSNGLIFRCDDCYSLYNVIKSLEYDSLISMRNTAYKKVVEKYTDCKMNENTIAVYHSIK